MKQTISTLIATLAILSAACSGAANSPTAPTTSTTIAQPLSGSPTAVQPIFFQREIDLTGTWSGAYTIPTCWPTNSPNSCTTYAKPGVLTLTLTQQGRTLAGVFKSDLLGSMDISGDVDSGGAIRFAGQRMGSLNCFGLGPLILGVTGTVAGETVSVNRTGGITATIKQSAYQTISSCYKTMFDYATRADDLRRDAPPGKTVIDRP